jgi:hypothetical protein
VKRRAALLAGAGAAATALGVVGSCGPSSIPDRRRQLLESWGTRTLLPIYATFEERLEELDTTARALGDAPSTETLEAAQRAWWAAREPWNQADVFAFGPYEDPLRLGARIDFQPARPESVEAVLAASEPLSGDGAIVLGAPAKGLSAVEYLLFAPEAGVLEAFRADARRAEYLALLTADLRAAAAELTSAWAPERGNFLAELTEAGRGSTSFDSLPAALGQIVNQIAYRVENIRDTKLGRPLGAKSNGSPQADRVESRFSGRSIDDIRDNLSGVERCFFGDVESGELGLDGYLKWRGKDLGPRFRERLAAAYDALAKIELPLVLAISEEPRAVSRVMDRLAELQRVIHVEVINALALTVTFGGNDGD